MPIDRENYETLSFASSAPSYDELLSSGDVLLMQKLFVVAGGGRILSDSFADYRSGDEIEIENLLGKTEKLRVAGILKEYPWYMDIVSDGCIVVPEENYPKLTEDYPDSGDSISLAVKMQDGKEEQAETSFSRLADRHNNVILRNEYRSRLESKKLFTVMSIFIYGFMTVIILICCVSVFNTINASLLMRKRETAMVRAAGMSRGQLIKTLLLECSLYGVIGTFWGSLIGVPLLLLLSAAFENVITASLLSPLKYVAVAFIASVLISIIAGAEPIRKIIKTPVIDQLRSQD